MPRSERTLRTRSTTGGRLKMILLGRVMTLTMILTIMIMSMSMTATHALVHHHPKNANTHTHTNSGADSRGLIPHPERTMANSNSYSNSILPNTFAPTEITQHNSNNYHYHYHREHRRSSTIITTTSSCQPQSNRFQRQQRRRRQHQQRKTTAEQNDVSKQDTAYFEGALPKTIPRLSDLLKQNRRPQPPKDMSSSLSSSLSSSNTTATTTTTTTKNSNSNSDSTAQQAMGKRQSSTTANNNNSNSNPHSNNNTNNNRKNNFNTKSTHVEPSSASASASAKPWKAGFQASIRTQGRIKKAFQQQHQEQTTTNESTSTSSPNGRAKRILHELWKTPPQYCNAANVVGALTFAAKALGTRPLPYEDLELRQLLWNTLDVLHFLVVDDQQLTTRQLCNAAWALAKHYDRDATLMMRMPSSSSSLSSSLSSSQYYTTGMSSDTAIGTAEEWNLSSRSTNSKRSHIDGDGDGDGDDGSGYQKKQQQRVDETVDELARQLTDIFNDMTIPPVAVSSSDEETSSKDDNSAVSTTATATAAVVDKQKLKRKPPQPPAKIGELCMASWAFGKLRPRTTPPGWQTPPQLRKVNRQGGSPPRDPATATPRRTSVVTFEQWGTSNNNNNDKRSEESEDGAGDVTENLFAAIGAALCEPPPSSSFSSDKWQQDKAFGRTFLEECSWSELANVGWSFAAHGSCSSPQAEGLLLALAQEARHRLYVGSTQDLKIRDIAQLLWALGTLQADNYRLADDLVELVQGFSEHHLRLHHKTTPSFGRRRPLQRWSCADLVQVTLSLAHARIDDLPFLRAIYEESNHRLLDGASQHDGSGSNNQPYNAAEGRRSFRPWEVSILLWSQARLYLKESEGAEFAEFAADAPKFLLKALMNSPGTTLQAAGVGAQEQANIVWSLTVLEFHQSRDAIELIHRIFLEAAQHCQDQGSIQLEHAHQLWQAYFLMQEESPDAIVDIPQWFVDYLRDKWTLEKARGKLSSARHRSLSQTLHFMGVDHYNEHDEDIDVAIVLKENASWTHETTTAADDKNERESQKKVSVAVEFDGPHHFTRERPDVDQPRALGHTVLKYRLLKKQGWTVVRVPYFEFDRIPFWASMERQRYLQRKLKTHANISFSEVDVSEYKVLQPNRESRFD